jgi:ubiquinone/menaquinone biosynthesis C-methylase UbiE
MLVSHMARYRFSEPLVQDAVVLDAGCGCGYGAHYLAMKGAQRVIGIDVAPQAIEYARSRYAAENLAFAVSDVTALAFPSEALDAVVCLEVFEHVADCNRLLAESRRVLKPSGRIIVSTPNKQVFSPGQREPVNPWHAREYSREEFASILASHFEDVQLWGQAFSTPSTPWLTRLHLRIQRFLVDRDSWFARGFEMCYWWAFRVSMLPARAALALMRGDPNVIEKVERFAPKDVMYFIAVGWKRTKHPSPRATNCTAVGSTSMPHRRVPEDAAAP